MDGNQSPPVFPNFMADLLPQYMIPHSFHQLEKFPLTPNGKINRNAITAIKK